MLRKKKITIGAVARSADAAAKLVEGGEAESIALLDLAVLGEHPQHGVEQPTPPAMAPTVGEHTDDVLGDVLGYDPEKIAALRDAGAFGKASKA